MKAVSSWTASFPTRLGLKLAGLRVAAEILIWRYGWVWVAAGLLLLAAAALSLIRDSALERDAAELEKERLALDTLRRTVLERRAAATRVVDSGERAQGDADRQAALAVLLVSPDQIGEQVRRVYALAAREQVGILQAEFRTEADASGIDRVQVNIPIKATYPALRRFLERCLGELPNISLDRLTFKRSQVGESQVEARIHLSLWTIGPGSHTPERAWTTLKQAEVRR